MFKMTHTRKDHAYTVFVTGIDRFLVADGTARLHNGRNALLGRNVHAVAEREIGIGGQYRSMKVEIKAVRLLNSLSQRIHTGGLTHA